MAATMNQRSLFPSTCGATSNTATRIVSPNTPLLMLTKISVSKQASRTPPPVISTPVSNCRKTIKRKATSIASSSTAAQPNIFATSTL